MNVILTAPVILWLQGVVYIDNPVGAGFSYTDNPACFAKSKDDVEVNLFEAVRQFFAVFVNLRSNDFYITGESYAGKYAPILGHAIFKNRNHPDPSYRINLKDVAIGNGVSDPVNQIVNFGEYYYQLGYIDAANRDIFNKQLTSAVGFINQGDTYHALLATFSLVNSKCCLFNNLTGYVSPYNALRYDGYNPTIDRVGAYLTNPNGIKNCLNVGNRQFAAFTDTNPVLTNLTFDIITSVAPYVAELADNNYRVIIYNGMLDLLINAACSEFYISTLLYSGNNAFNNAKRQIWRVGDDIDGYYKIGGGITFVAVRDAGHLVPVDQPVWAYELIRKLTTGTSF